MQVALLLEPASELLPPPTRPSSSAPLLPRAFLSARTHPPSPLLLNGARRAEGYLPPREISNPAVRLESLRCSGLISNKWCARFWLVIFLAPWAVFGFQLNVSR